MICKECSNEFFSEAKKQIFCSKKCCDRNFHQRHPHRHKEYMRKYRLKTLLLCHYCGKPIAAENRKWGVRYCSAACVKSQRKVQGKKYRLVKKQLVESHKLKAGCARCGYKVCAAALDFHHLNPATKEMSLKQSSWSSRTSRSENELKKCIILCKNCHYETHNGIPFYGNAMHRIR